MDSSNLKSKQLPIQYTDDGGWSLSETDLNNHIKANFDELRQHVLATKDISNKKMIMAAILVTAMTVIIATMALAGAHLWAFILGLIALADVGPVLKFLEKNND